MDFMPSNILEEYQAYIHTLEQQSIFTEEGLSTFYIGVYKDAPYGTIMKFRGHGDVLKHIFMNLATKAVVKFSDHIIDETAVIRWIN